MAAVKGVQATKIAAGGIANQTAEGVQDARAKVIADYYEASSLAAASTLTIGGTLPAGARVQEVILTADALSAGVSATVGDSADGDRYITLTALTSVSVTRSNAVDGIDYVVGTTSGDNQVVVTFSGPSTATGTIKCVVFYTKD